MKAVFLFSLTAFGIVLGVIAAESPAMSTDMAMRLFSIACVTIGAGALNWGLMKTVEKEGEEQ